MFEELKETVSTGWGENIGTISHKVEYVNKEVTFIKKKQILVLKSKVSEIRKKKNPLCQAQQQIWPGIGKNPQTLKICLLRYLG